MTATLPTAGLPARNSSYWQKLGLVFKVDNLAPWAATHAMVPTPLLLKDRIRVFFSSRSTEKKSHIGYVDLDRQDPTKTLGSSSAPVLAPGDPGTFDDSGVTCNCAVDLGNGLVHLYYLGWSQGNPTPYRNTIGLAISRDGGATFKRHSRAPIMDRTPDEPFFCISPWVLKEGDNWHMWYGSVTEWLLVNGKYEPIYHIKYAASKDGIHWQRDNTSCIVPLKKDEASARPTVIKENGGYKMWYCYRGSFDFRDGADAYRLGYAESADGKTWTRHDDRISATGLGPDSGVWDDKQQAYPALVQADGRSILFYNGNGFGAEGFGCAVRPA